MIIIVITISIFIKTVENNNNNYDHNYINFDNDSHHRNGFYHALVPNILFFNIIADHNNNININLNHQTKNNRYNNYC